MKIRVLELRSLRPAEVDFEAWFLPATLLAACAAWFWLRAGLPWPKCWLRHSFGIPCPTCGSTRTALCFAQGHFGAAFQINPLAALAYVGVLVYDVYAGCVLALRLPRCRLTSIPRKVKQAFGILLVAVVIVNWTYLILHLS